VQEPAGASLIDVQDRHHPAGPGPHEEDGAEHRAEPTGGERRSRSPLFAVLILTAVAVYAADQLTKAWALRTLTPGESVDVVGHLIRLQLIRNPGAAFSLGDDATWLLTLIACVVLVVIITTARRLGSRGWAWGLGLLLGGSVGNLTDRLLRAPGPGRGHVVDFIDYFGWFIGNVADIAIVGAAALIAVLALRGIGVDGSRPEHGRHEARQHG
jgi:signal peptidase II